MRKLVWVVAPLCFIAAPTSAEIFKCAGKDGVVVYQNFPCHVDSLGSLPTGPTLAAAVSPPNGSAQAKTAPIKAQPTEPQVGMTAEEVRAIWGDPTDTFNEEPGAGGRVEVWAYGSDRSVRFDHRSRVTVVQKQGG
jgi:Domain of unknown function (DUF4124)